MTVRDVIDRYYDCVNRGDWEQWLTLFSDDVVGDEQLAGHFDGIGVLRGAIDGIAQRLPRVSDAPAAHRH